MLRKGREYEELVEKIFNLITENTEYDEIKRNIKIDTRYGQREIDILMIKRHTLYDLKIVVECKNQKAKVSIGVIDQLHSKLLDVGANKGIIVSRSGFSSKAISKAKELNISLFRADHIKAQDFLDEEIPILVTQFEANGSGTKFVISLHQETDPSIIANDRTSLLVNDKNVFDWLAEKWNNEEFEIPEDRNEKVIQFPEVNEKYIRSKFGKKLAIKDFHIELSYDTIHYFGLVPKTAGGYIIEEVIKGESHIYLPFGNSIGFTKHLRKVNLNEVVDFGNIKVRTFIKKLI